MTVFCESRRALRAAACWTYLQKNRVLVVVFTVFPDPVFGDV
jgi:hypothetical protein